MNKSTYLATSLEEESEFTSFPEEYKPNYFSSSSKEEYISTYATGSLREYVSTYITDSQEEKYLPTYTPVEYNIIGSLEEENRSAYITGFSNEENTSIYVTGSLEECYESTYHAALPASMAKTGIYHVINYNN
ncbi:hypothetical protein F8M41_025311 [Gigaspora margarita]|uniref:Uncharacterized protein n=1 Tax=Gigaspora margarita TaxID=4874 RepID=A0A8H3XKC6_GIGMA|nr:hypothetical protein F8M41_025311 [Gigaspora margarita]